MNKNKKVIKFQRKEMLISNPLSTEQSATENQKKPDLGSKQSVISSVSEVPHVPMGIPSANLPDKLEIPKQVPLQNVSMMLKNKFISMMDAQPLIKVDQLFDNPVVQEITGGRKQCRKSFGKKSPLKPEQTPEQEDENYKFFDQVEPNYYPHPHSHLYAQQNPIPNSILLPPYPLFGPENQYPRTTIFQNLFQSQQSQIRDNSNHMGASNPSSKYLPFKPNYPYPRDLPSSHYNWANFQ